MIRSITAALLLLVSVLPFAAHAGAGLISYGGEKIILLVDLPNKPKFRDRKGEFIDIGYIYKSVEVLFIPIWQYDGRLVGYPDSKDHSRYLQLTEEDVNDLLHEANMQLPPEPYLDFWHRIGGKLVLTALLIGLIIRYKLRAKEKGQYRSAEATPINRLEDILVNGQGYQPLAIDELLPQAHPALHSVNANPVLNSIFFVTLIDTSKLNEDNLKEELDVIFEQLVPLKKQLKIKRKAVIFVFCLMSDKALAEDTVKQWQKYRNRKITSNCNASALVIDCEQQKVWASKLSIPSLAVLQSCFEQAPETTQAPASA